VPGEQEPEPLTEDELDWAWAREMAERSPDWSDEQWRKINAGLGYRVRTGKRPETRKPPTT
jgi:hypothetical protein